jgi:amino acid adenylation domain-containing protein
MNKNQDSEELNGLIGNHQTIISFFKLVKEKSGQKTAVIYQDNSLNYEELDQLSDQLANYMHSRKEINAGDYIGVKLEKSEYLIAVILAVIKSGCAYVPIDPGYPAQRIQFIDNDSNCKFIFDKNELEKALSSPRNNQKPETIISPDDAAYVIYTSGTTGNPKGVVISHRNLINLLFAPGTPFDLKSSDVWTMFHSHCFDFSVWEIFCPLLTGGTLIVLDRALVRDPVQVKKVIEDYGVTMFSQTPSSFYMLTPAFKSAFKENKLRYIFFGGEALSPMQLSWWHSVYPELNFLNLYGTTETTIHVTAKLITAKEIDNNTSNIGKALPGYFCYVLGKRREKLPFGTEGELAVGGAGLSGCYLNNETLTHEKYIDNPFSEHNADKLYLTGDIVKKLPDGELIYVGRKDRQVKIRGHRIELSEIELALLTKPGISYVRITTTAQEDGQSELLVFLISAFTEHADELAAFLKDKLPGHMIPLHYVQLEEIILNSNGKLDEQLLLEKYALLSVNPRQKTAPRDAIDEKVLEIWYKKLGISDLGIDHNLFEIGGNSLKSISIINEVNEVFGLSLPLGNLLGDFTVRRIADEINKVVLNSANETEDNNDDQEKEIFSI